MHSLFFCLFLTIYSSVETVRVVPFEFPSDVMVGTRTKVMCSVSQGEPPLTFNWTYNGRQIDSRQESSTGIRVESNVDYSILSIKSVEVSHAGNYSCHVSNQTVQVTHSSVLRVNEPPKWLSEPLDTSTTLGHDVRMDCSAHGNPKPIVSWKKANGDPWDLSPIFDGPHYTLHSNGSVVVHDANREVDGLYFCSASNGFGSDISKLIRLTVHEPARFVTRMKSESRNKKDTIELECSASGDGPIEISWIKEDKVIKEAKDRFLIQSTEDKGQKLTSSKLMIVEADRSDGGVYQCNATNKWGHDYSLIQLIVKEIPERPAHLTVTNVTGHTVNLTWFEPFNGNGVISKYMVKVSDAVTNETVLESESFVVNGVNGQSNASLTGLSPNSAFRAEVLAMNEVGWSLPSPPVFFRTEEAAPSGPPLSVSATATGPNSIKISWKAPEEKYWNGKISGFYVGYVPSTSLSSYHEGQQNIEEHYKVIETSKRGTSTGMNSEAGRQVSSPDSFDRYEAHLTNLQRSTRYTAYVKAFNTKGKGPPSDPVIVKTLDDVPPTAPSLSLHSSSASSITISWSVLNSLRVTGVQKFILYYKKLNSNHDWREVPIHSQSMTHTIGNLECGTAYEFFMTAHNSVGKSEPSVPLVARTQGSVPSSPRSSEIFAKIATTEAVINLSSWKASECLITDFSIRIRSKHPLPPGSSSPLDAHSKGDWLLLTSRHGSNSSSSSSSSPSNSLSSSPSFLSASSSLMSSASTMPSMSSTSSHFIGSNNNNNVILSSTKSPTTGVFSVTENFFFIRNLLPHTSYELEVTAKNSAGTTQAQYDFYTKSLEGVFKVKPSDNNAGLMTKYDGNHPIFSYHSPHGLLTSSSLGLITPLIVSSLILVLIIVIACIVCSKDSFLSLQAFHRSSNITHRHHESPGSDFMSNGNDSKQPFQGALSLKDLSFNVLDAVHRQTPMSVVEMESNHESCLSQQQSHLQQQQLSNYARPYDIFPVVSMASVIDSSTLRRVTAAGGGSACILPSSSSTAAMDLGSVSERGAGGSIRGTGVYNF